MNINAVFNSILESCEIYEAKYHFSDYTLFVTRDLYLRISALYPDYFTMDVKTGQRFFRGRPVELVNHPAEPQRFWIGFDPTKDIS